ncbi:hypothetical protein GCM10027589_14040 [Actinocorallia lasiicapitis]
MTAVLVAGPGLALADALASEYRARGARVLGPGTSEAPDEVVFAALGPLVAVPERALRADWEAAVPLLDRCHTWGSPFTFAGPAHGADPGYDQLLDVLTQSAVRGGVALRTITTGPVLPAAGTPAGAALLAAALHWTRSYVHDRDPSHLTARPLRVLGSPSALVDVTPAKEAAAAIAAGHPPIPRTLPLPELLALLGTTLGCKVLLTEDPADLTTIDHLLAARLGTFAATLTHPSPTPSGTATHLRTVPTPVPSDDDAHLRTVPSPGSPGDGRLRVRPGTGSPGGTGRSRTGPSSGSSDDAEQLRTSPGSSDDDGRLLARPGSGSSGLVRDDRWLRTLLGPGSQGSSRDEGRVGAEPLVVVNALGQGGEYWTRLLARLGEGRPALLYSPAADGPDGGVATFEDHLVGLDDFVVAHGGGPVHLVGWCTGAKTVLAYRSRHPGRVRSVTLLNPAFRHPGRAVELDSDYERRLDDVARLLGDRPRYAGRMARVLSAGLFAEARPSDEQGAARVLVAAAHPELDDARSRPFADEGALLAYTAQLREFWSRDVRADAAGVTVPLLVIAGTLDEIVTLEGIRAAVGALPRARLVELEFATHYAMFDRAQEVAELIDDLVRTV